jgi:hypothetical protein
VFTSDIVVNACLEDREGEVVMENSTNQKNLLDFVTEVNGTGTEDALRTAGISRPTAAKQLKELVSDGLVKEYSCGHSQMHVCQKQECLEKVAEKDSNSATTFRVPQESLKTAKKPVGDA